MTMRMGWSFKWMSAFDTEFNLDYHVSFTPEELAKKKAFYNFTEQDPGPPEREGISVFTRIRRAMCFTPTRPMPVVST